MKYRLSSKKRRLEIIGGSLLFLLYLIYVGFEALLNFWFWLALGIFLYWVFATLRSSIVLKKDSIVIKHFFNSKVKFRDIIHLNTNDQGLEIKTDKREYLISNNIQDHQELIQAIRSGAQRFKEN
jgi:hypothetical protein